MRSIWCDRSKPASTALTRGSIGFGDWGDAPTSDMNKSSDSIAVWVVLDFTRLLSHRRARLSIGWDMVMSDMDRDSMFLTFDFEKSNLGKIDPTDCSPESQTIPKVRSCILSSNYAASLHVPMIQSCKRWDKVIKVRSTNSWSFPAPNDKSGSSLYMERVINFSVISWTWSWRVRSSVSRRFTRSKIFSSLLVEFISLGFQIGSNRTIITNYRFKIGWTSCGCHAVNWFGDTVFANQKLYFGFIALD